MEGERENGRWKGTRREVQTFFKQLTVSLLMLSIKKEVHQIICQVLIQDKNIHENL